MLDALSLSAEALATAAARRWVPDAEAPLCSCCAQPFSLLRRRHHCRECLQVVCSACSPDETPEEELPVASALASARAEVSLGFWFDLRASD